MMYSRLLKFCCMILLVFLVCVPPAAAAGSVTFSDEVKTSEGDMWEIKATCTGDASDGTVPDTAIPLDLRGWVLYQVETVPGTDALAPTGTYAIAVVNTRGTDLLQGFGAARSATVKQIAFADAPASVSTAVSVSCGNLGASNVTYAYLNFRRQRK